METTGKEISRQRDVMGELCQKEYLLHVHRRRERKVEGRGDESKFLLHLYIWRTTLPDPA